MSKVQSITFEAGALVVQTDSGPPTRWPIADVLRAADIPALTQTQVVAIKALANLVVILIRSLIARDLLDEDFVDDGGMDWDLDHIIYAIEQMGGSYHEPSLDDAGG